MHTAKRLVYETNLFARGHKNECFTLKVGLDKRPEDVEFFV